MSAKPIPAIVLLVEDHAVIAMNTEILLDDLGVAEVHSVSSASAALALAEAKRFDFAILDFHLREGEDSLPVADLMLAQGVPYAFATGLGEVMVLPDAHQSATVLKKPYSYEDLRDLLSGD